MTDQEHAAAIHAARRDDWRNISTAPKDGTQILMCRAKNADGKTISPLSIFCQTAAWWACEGGDGRWMVYCSLVREPELHFEPTHWMPIPAPPRT